MKKNLDKHEQDDFSMQNRLTQYMEDCFCCFKENSMALEEDLIDYAQENTFKVVGIVMVVMFVMKKLSKRNHVSSRNLPILFKRITLMEKIHTNKIKLMNRANHIYQKLNNLINKPYAPHSNFFNQNGSFTDAIQHQTCLANEMNNIYSKINDLYAEEIQMRISKNKIQNYIDKMSALCAAVISERKSNLSFDPVDVVNMAISSCSVLNTYPKIKLLVPKKIPKVIGNPIPYLQAITMLLNSIAKITDKYIYLKLKSCTLENNKVIFELNVDLINAKKEYEESVSSSFNRQLNYDFFLIRKTLSRINGKLIVDDNHASTISFIVVSTFTKNDEDDSISPDKELTYVYNLEIQKTDKRSKYGITKESGVTASLPVTLFNSTNNPVSNADIFQSNFNKEQTMKGELLFDEVARIRQQRKDNEIKHLFVERKNINFKNIKLRNERIKNQIQNETYKRHIAYKKFK